MKRTASMRKMLGMATVAFFSNPRKGTSLLLLSLKFNPLVARIALFHTQISTNPFAPDTLAQMGPTQIQKLLSEKQKLGFDKLDHGLSLFRRMVQLRSRLSVINFNQLLTAVAKMKQYSTVVSLFAQIRELGVPIDEYT
ncbi:hypothetical protein RHMOL_Rhmol02G0035900 [Rhododendron molle]|uniref:Uncharacterized protein n=1 Tax=Rhododendron molle TaxID=49168 RepID=A0ACC0PPE2_RHOML|nr:hypothetical protein RHMOL_Rhmol02G0035900 [Rhododendron molle]